MLEPAEKPPCGDSTSSPAVSWPKQSVPPHPDPQSCSQQMFIETLHDLCIAVLHMHDACMSLTMCYIRTYIMHGVYCGAVQTELTAQQKDWSCLILTFCWCFPHVDKSCPQTPFHLQLQSTHRTSKLPSGRSNDVCLPTACDQTHYCTTLKQKQRTGCQNCPR